MIPKFTEKPRANESQPLAHVDEYLTIAQQTGAKTYTTRSAHELSQVYDTLGSRLSYELAIGNRAGNHLAAILDGGDSFALLEGVLSGG